MVKRALQKVSKTVRLINYERRVQLFGSEDTYLGRLAGGLENESGLIVDLGCVDHKQPGEVRMRECSGRGISCRDAAHRASPRGNIVL